MNTQVQSSTSAGANGTKAVPNHRAKRRFNKINKGKNKSPQFTRPVKRDAPKFLYYVQGTDILAVKAPCEHKLEDRVEGKASECSLGTWQNPMTHKKCKVTRKVNKVKEPEKEVNPDVQTE